MAGMFGSSAKNPVRMPGGGTGYTSKRRRHLLEGMGVPLDSRGFIIQPGQASAAQPFGGGVNPWMAGMGGGSPFGQMGGFLPGMFARPQAAAMLGQPWGGGGFMNPFMSYAMQQPSFNPWGMSGPSPWGNVQQGNPFAGLMPGGKIPVGNPGLEQMPTVDWGGGRASGSTGTRGPDQDPFAALRRYAGPSGNGGGAILPAMGMNAMALR